VTIRSIDCLSPGGDVTDLGVEVRPGPNLTVLVEGPVRLSWHLHSDRTGWLPTGGGAQAWGGAVRPIDLWPAGSTAPFPPTELQPYPWDLVHMFQTSGGFDLPAPWEHVAEAPHGADRARPRLRVLLVAHMFPVPYDPVSGAFVFESAKAIVDRGDVAVRVVCPVPFWGPGRRRLRAWRAAQAAYAVAIAQARQHVYRLDGVEVQYVPYYVPKDWHRHADAVATAVDALRPEIERFGPDLVHAHSGYLDGHAASRISTALRVPLVITEHTGPLQRLFDDGRIAGKIVAAYRAATVVLGVSSFQAGEIRRLAPGVTSKVAVQFNGYDATAYSPGDPTLHLSPTLIYVGYITPGKGLDVLVRAFAQVAERLPGARLLVAGDVADQQTMSAMLEVVRAHRIEHLVEFVGGCTRAQVADLMRTADALVLPSEGETFGCVLVEALGSGRMVVATACGGPEDIAGDEPAARLVPVGDPVELAGAIEALWRARLDPALHPASVAARAAARFDYRTVAGQLVDRYDTIVAAAGPRPEGTP
jgi:glycosyltransferase involved in cell wall biosynthesis